MLKGRQVGEIYRHLLILLKGSIWGESYGRSKKRDIERYRDTSPYSFLRNNHGPLFYQAYF
jgi:hypothetical protein